MKILCYAILILTAYALETHAQTANSNPYPTTGYLGLGVSSANAQSKLHISGIERYSLRLYRDGNTNNYLSLWQGTAGAGMDPVGTGMLFLGYDVPTTVIINNKLGIGTSSPQEKLHVEGNIYVNTNQIQFASAAGGVNRIQSFAGAGPYGTWLFKSRFDHLVLDAGEDAPNARKIIFRTGGADRMFVDSYGNVGIGTSVPDKLLTVRGTIHSNEVIVDLSVPGPDYVFEKGYNLPPLNDLKAYITTNKHLPEVPSAQEMETNGVKLREMNMTLLKKVEELTLYILDLNAAVEEMKGEVEQQRSVIEELKRKTN